MPRGRPIKTMPEGPGKAFARFVLEEFPKLEMTNDEIAKKLGYMRPNIVSAWKTAASKIPLDNVVTIADLFGVDLAYILALYIEQYAGNPEGVSDFDRIAATLSRLCTPEEWELVLLAREVRAGNSLPLTADQRRVIAAALTPSEPLPEGPYKPVVVLGDEGEGDRRKFARRGFERHLSADEAIALRMRASAVSPSSVLEEHSPAVEAEPAPTELLIVKVPVDHWWSARYEAVRRGLRVSTLLAGVFEEHLRSGEAPKPVDPERLRETKGFNLRLPVDLRRRVKADAVHRGIKLPDYAASVVIAAIEPTLALQAPRAI